MATFTDSSGHTHLFRLTCFNVDLIKECVKDLDGVPIDLLSILDEQFDEDNQQSLLNRILADRRILCRILFVAMSLEFPQGEAFDKFLKLMDADALDSASDAFVAEIINLFPRHKRETLRRLVETHVELETQIQTLIQQQNQEYLTGLASHLKIPRLPENLSGNLLEFSESTPDPSLLVS